MGYCLYIFKKEMVIYGSLKPMIDMREGELKTAVDRQCVF